MYLDHRTVDGLNNFIVDVHTTPGNAHDSKPYLSRVDYILNKYHFHTKQVGLDSGYYSWEIMEGFEGRGIFSAIAYRRFNTTKEDRTSVQSLKPDEAETWDYVGSPESSLQLILRRLK